MLILLVFVNIVNICPYSTLSAQVVWSILLSSISSSFMFLLNSPRNWGAQRCQDFDSGIREILSKFQTNMATLQLFDFANFVRHFSHYIFLLQFTLWEQETKHCQRQTAVNHNLFSQKDYNWDITWDHSLTFTFTVAHFHFPDCLLRSQPVPTAYDQQQARTPSESFEGTIIFFEIV